MLARILFPLVRFAARKGLAGSDSDPRATDAARRHGIGVRGETYAYWHLRRLGYILIARNYRSPEDRAELDLVGYDGETLAFIEVKTRTLPPQATFSEIASANAAPRDSAPDRAASGRNAGSGTSCSKFAPLPEENITAGKRHAMSRIAKRFLRERRLLKVPYRFDVLAIENRPGHPPVVRLHKAAFSGD
jgi:Holliday junction resolvase-like predicted endonuclease